MVRRRLKTSNTSVYFGHRMILNDALLSLTVLNWWTRSGIGATSFLANRQVTNIFHVVAQCRIVLLFM